MPLIDMPLEKLKTYQGLNPKPADFDAFWDRSFEEMRSLAPQLELRPADFKCPIAECYDMYFTGVGGARIHGKLLGSPFRKLFLLRPSLLTARRRHKNSMNGCIRLHFYSSMLAKMLRSRDETHF